jgi:hypothetical protein
MHAVFLLVWHGHWHMRAEQSISRVTQPRQDKTSFGYFMINHTDRHRNVRIQFGQLVDASFAAQHGNDMNLRDAPLEISSTKEVRVK